jgi:hypothetical protein
MQEISDTQLPVDHAEWRHGDIRHFEVYNLKLTGLSSEFDTELTEGIRDTIEWIRRHHDGSD